MPTPTTQPDFAALLATATTDPGTISAAYSAFHNYSLGNQILAMIQCHARGIPLGPLASFYRWKELGRHVRRGEKAIELCMPITCKRTTETVDAAGNTASEDVAFTRFVYRRNWFVLSQTEGDAYVAPTPATWDTTHALAALNVTEIPFDLPDGNCQGFARGRSIAVSPIAAHPLKTTFHELAHVIIGHTTEGELRDDERTPRNLRELEAEATAMLVCAALALPGIDEARGYIQAWYGVGQQIPEASARKIFKAADAILRAGREGMPDESTTNPVQPPRERQLPA
jgi:antirestriction protein ArdC